MLAYYVGGRNGAIPPHEPTSIVHCIKVDWVEDVERAIRWIDATRIVHASISAAEEAARTLGAAIWDRVTAPDVFPRQLPADIAQVLESLNEHLGNASRFAERFSAEPLERLIRGLRLSRSDYYTLRAAGFFKIGHPPTSCDEYQLFDSLHYEDTQRRYYINPDERPQHRGRVRLRFGRPPEEVDWKNLRAEQREFFRRHLPNVATRFKGFGEP